MGGYGASRYGGSIGAGYKPRKRYGTSKSKGRSTSYKNAKAIAALNKRTGGFMGLELKFVDFTHADAALTVNGNVADGEQDNATTLCWNAMVEGTGESERLGRFISMKSVSLKGQIEIGSQEALGSPPHTEVFSIYLILDKQANGAVANSEDVFTNPASTNADGLTSMFINMENTDRFQILDSTRVFLKPEFVLDGEAPTTFASIALRGTFNLKYRWNRGKKVLFEGTGGTIANIRDNAVHLMIFSTFAASLVVNGRCRYTTS